MFFTQLVINNLQAEFKQFPNWSHSHSQMGRVWGEVMGHWVR